MQERRVRRPAEPFEKIKVGSCMDSIARAIEEEVVEEFIDGDFAIIFKAQQYAILIMFDTVRQEEAFNSAFLSVAQFDEWGVLGFDADAVQTVGSGIEVVGVADTTAVFGLNYMEHKVGFGHLVVRQAGDLDGLVIFERAEEMILKI